MPQSKKVEAGLLSRLGMTRRRISEPRRVNSPSRYFQDEQASRIQHWSQSAQRADGASNRH